MVGQFFLMDIIFFSRKASSMVYEILSCYCVKISLDDRIDFLSFLVEKVESLREIEIMNINLFAT